MATSIVTHEYLWLTIKSFSRPTIEKKKRIVDETRLLVGHIPYVIIDKFCYKHQRQMFNLMHM